MNCQTEGGMLPPCPCSFSATDMSPVSAGRRLPPGRDSTVPCAVRQCSQPAWRASTGFGGGWRRSIEVRRWRCCHRSWRAGPRRSGSGKSTFPDCPGDFAGARRGPGGVMGTRSSVEIPLEGRSRSGPLGGAAAQGRAECVAGAFEPFVGADLGWAAGASARPLRQTTPCQTGSPTGFSPWGPEGDVDPAAGWSTRKSCPQICPPLHRTRSNSSGLLYTAGPNRPQSASKRQFSVRKPGFESP
jgi:hypothetical protein